MIEAGLVQRGLVKRGLVSAIIEAQSRYFNFFDGVQEYVQLAQPVTLGGSFEISVLIYPTADRAHILADNRSGNADRLFFEEVSNKIEIFVAGTAVTFSGFPPANKLSLLTLSRDSSNNYTCVLNGVSLNITAGQGAGGSFSFNSIGGQFGGTTSVPTFAGIEANVRITDNGTLIHNWAIDDNSNVIADSVNPLGSELYDFSNVGTTESVDIVETTSGFTATATLPFMDRTYINLSTTAGETYRLRSSRKSLSGSTSLFLFVRDGVDGSGTIITSTSEIDVDIVFTAASSTTTILYDATNTSNLVSYEIGDISIRQATGYGTLVNPSGGWGLFDKQGDGDWLGQELSAISITPPLGDDSDPEFATVFSSVVGNEYRISAAVVSYLGSNDAGWSGGGVPASAPYRGTNLNAGDVLGGDFISSIADQVKLFGRAGSVTSYNRISAKRLLRVA